MCELSENTASNLASEIMGFNCCWSCYEELVVDEE